MNPGKHQQRGGTFLGFVLGAVVGLGLALGVAVYVTNVPVPFVSRGQSRSADQDAAESLKNKNWDPNAPLYGKNPAKPAAAAPVQAASEPKVDATPVAVAKPEAKPAASADPLGDLAKAQAAASTSAEPFTYFVQVGAFRAAEEAENHRAKLALSGIDAKVSEKEQSGRTVFRVRVGPFEKKDEAEKSKEKLEAAGLETALVRVQRS